MIYPLKLTVFCMYVGADYLFCHGFLVRSLLHITLCLNANNVASDFTCFVFVEVWY